MRNGQNDMPTDETEALLRELLIAAAEAHGRYEAEALGGAYDDDWPAWYAAHMARALRDTDRRIGP